LSGVAMRIDRWTSAFCVGVRPAVALRRRTHSDADQTHNASIGLSGPATPDMTKQSVLSVSCLA